MLRNQFFLNESQKEMLKMSEEDIISGRLISQSETRKLPRKNGVKIKTNTQGQAPRIVNILPTKHTTAPLIPMPGYL